MSRLSVEHVPVASLTEDPHNARKHDAKNIAALTASLKRFGQQKPIVVSDDGVVIAGNGTFRAARSLGWTEIAVVRTALTGADRAAYALADNRIAELAQWDDTILADTLRSCRDESVLAAIGFTDSDVQRILGESTPEDAVPEPPEDAVSRPGDVWLLGDHRLLCGDSAKREDVERLLAGARIHLVNTDPPYNVKVEPRSNNAIAAGLSSPKSADRHHQALDLARHPEKAKPTHAKMRPKDRPIMNDSLPPEEFERLLLAWVGNLAFAMEPGASFYIWGGYANCAIYPPALKANGLYFSQAVIWNKLHPVLIRKDFMGAHEWCFYGWREGAGHRFYGPNNATDLWEIRKVTPQSRIHITEKPVELAARAIEYSSRRGENVLDLFGGSGSTLMACEHTGRKAFLMEIDPIYCDVIIRRWRTATGREATLNGRPWSTIATERAASDIP